MSTATYDWRKVIAETQIGDPVKPGDASNFLDMARSLSRGSVWSIPYESLRTLGPPEGGAQRSFTDATQSAARWLRPTVGGTAEAAAQKKLGITSVAPDNIVALNPRADAQEIEQVIRACYKQVFGNTYILESDRLTTAESLLRNRSISVREFVRLLAKSDLYRSRFFEKTSNNRFIELNFKHLLGRAPYDHGEIQEHFGLYCAKGYAAEIDSYIDSDEYRALFGEDIVPYFRGFKYQTSQAAAAYPRMLKLWSGDAGSDTDRNRNGQRTLVTTADLVVSGQFSKPL
jgi:hypothetical protein